jgi:hypothetical protein
MTAAQLQEYREEQAELMAQAVDAAELLAEVAAAADADQFREIISQIPGARRGVKKLPSRVEVKLVSCRYCRTATLKLTMLIGRSRRELSSTELSRDFLGGMT